MQSRFPLELAYAWVTPGALLAAAIGIACVALLRSESARTRGGLILAGVVFLGGAVVLELVGSLVLQHFQMVTWHFAVAYHVEEILEILGVTMALVTVLATIQTAKQSEGISS